MLVWVLSLSVLVRRREVAPRASGLGWTQCASGDGRQLESWRLLVGFVFLRRCIGPQTWLPCY
ncbi:hypothetical protein RchiOBHm_Chr6g0299101 [Rosa chinensis]|uniref:Uncharacterized protein n=1 Tax=Rosa chinensis TaxID=74649 RepID=A0A2P6PY44_ROSCH|nr:hypothetical protein RchiOBHm_Chr6g0299101 [Rosa chinensis]